MVIGMGGRARGIGARPLVAVVLGAFGAVHLLGARGWGLPAVLVVLGLQAAWLWWRADERLLLGQAVVALGSVLGFGLSPALVAPVAGIAAVARRRGAAALILLAALVIGTVRAPDEALSSAITVGLTAGVVAVTVVLLRRTQDLEATRGAVAASAVERERLRLAEELNGRLGSGLEEIAREGRAALERPELVAGMIEGARRTAADVRAVALDLRSLSLRPETATAEALLRSAGISVTVDTAHREPLASAGTLLAVVLREAVTDVVRQGTATHCTIRTWNGGDGMVGLRVSHDGVSNAALGTDALLRAGERIEAAGGTLRTGLDPDGTFFVEAAAVEREPPPTDPAAHRLSVALLATVLTGFCLKALLMIPWGASLAAATACLAAFAFLALRWRGPERPRAWRWSLAAEAALAYLPMIWFGETWLGVPGFLAGTLMVAFARPVPFVLAIMAGVAWAAHGHGLEPAAVANHTISTLVSGVVVFVLVRLARVIREMQEAGEELARAATVRERLRTARDLHDILGHTMAAILLKGELARRLPPERAARELAELVEMAELAKDELAPSRGTTLDGELARARDVLAGAGIDPRFEAAHGDLPERLDTVYGIVVRESVTNILRHSSASTCRIASTPTTLTVENDAPRGRTGPPGSGLGNLTTRLAELGGTLSVTTGPGLFRIEATVPPASPATDPATDPAGAPTASPTPDPAPS